MEPTCKLCRWWKRDYGIWTVTGWTGMDRTDGYCCYERDTVNRDAEAHICHHFEDKTQK